MQTFLPYADYRASAAILDRQRLGKQRVEAKQIMLALTGQSRGWVNHPATRMWRGHERELAWYGVEMCSEWKSRGYNDSLLPFFVDAFLSNDITGAPAWLGDPGFHLAHRSNLVRKAPDIYGPEWPDVPADLPYVWPVS